MRSCQAPPLFLKIWLESHPPPPPPPPFLNFGWSHTPPPPPRHDLQKGGGVGGVEGVHTMLNTKDKFHSISLNATMVDLVFNIALRIKTFANSTFAFFKNHNIFTNIFNIIISLKNSLLHMHLPTFLPCLPSWSRFPTVKSTLQ